MGKIITDCDFLISLWDKNQSTHSRAQKKLKTLTSAQFYVLDVATYELVSVVSRRFDLSMLSQARSFIEESPVTIIDSREYEDEIWDEFWSHPQKGISFVDCANKVIAQRWKCKIASFDDFYPEDLKI